MGGTGRWWGNMEAVQDTYGGRPHGMIERHMRLRKAWRMIVMGRSQERVSGSSLPGHVTGAGGGGIVRRCIVLKTRCSNPFR